MATTSAKTTEPQDIDLDAMLADLDLELNEAEEPSASEPKKEAVSDDLEDLLGDLDIEEASASGSEEVSLDELESLLDDELESLPEEKPQPKKKTGKKAAPKKNNSELYSDDEVFEAVEAAPETKSEEVEENKKKAAKKAAKKADDGDSEPKPKKEPTKAAPKTGSRSVKVDPGLPASEQLIAKLGESGKNLLVVEDGVKLEAAVIDALPKKVKEKLHNLFAHLHNGNAISTYTIRALDLIAKNGEATTTELIANYQEKWSKGTSASQVGQVVRLFKDLKICNVEGKTLTPNKSSRLLPLLIKTEEEIGA